jgi:hypothetical protein
VRWVASDPGRAALRVPEDAAAADGLGVAGARLLHTGVFSKSVIQ